MSVFGRWNPRPCQGTGRAEGGAATGRRRRRRGRVPHFWPQLFFAEMEKPGKGGSGVEAKRDPVSLLESTVKLD